MYKLIIFDLDGPILDSFEAAKESVLLAIKKLTEKNLIAKGKLPSPTKETFILYWGYSGGITIKKFFPSISEKEAKLYLQFWVENEGKKRLPLVKGTKETLKKLKKGNYLTALATTRSHNLKFHLKNLNLGKYFDFVQSWDNPNLSKEKICPNHIFHPSLKNDVSFFDELNNFARQNNILLNEILFIDDTLTGLRLTRKIRTMPRFARQNLVFRTVRKYPRKIGITFLGVCTGPLYSKRIWQKYGNLDKKYVIKSIAELPEWLEKYNKRV